MEENSLQGRVALVTGGGTGIGREIALALSRAGARVALSGRRAEKLQGVARELEAAGTIGRAIQADVRDPAAVSALVETIEHDMGPLDIVINNAATFARGEVRELEVEKWNDVIATNLTGAFLVTRAALPGMVQRRRGSIVFISSTSGKRGDPGLAAYSAAKFGLMGLAHSLLYEVRRHDIRVIVVSPSLIDTRHEQPDYNTVKGVTAHAADVAESVVHCLRLPGRAMVRELEIWGTNP
ncbi:MAG TPA: SDR family NAD(P)-dependent oxidoreductase [Candidatus Krumholzibacteria bacterium]|nr:SDR family NAD(P)-dependent oxidoreductase [Candidatus Krumholzibacteria bacterium]